MNKKQTKKLLKKRKQTNVLEERLSTLHCVQLLCLLLYQTIRHQMFGHPAAAFISLLFVWLGFALPWRRHWLWVLEVGHDNCRDRQPANATGERQHEDTGQTCPYA